MTAHGEKRGDRVLQSVARLIAEERRSSDVIARLDDDDFAAMLPGTDGAGAEILANRLLRRLSKTHYSLDDGKSASLTFSIGLAELGPAAKDGRALMATAEAALVAARAAGRNRVAKTGAPGPKGQPELKRRARQPRAR